MGRAKVVGHCGGAGRDELEIKGEESPALGVKKLL